MDLAALSDGLRYGTAQVLTFVIPIGTLLAVCLWGYFQRTPKLRRPAGDQLIRLEDLRPGEAAEEKTT